MADTNYPQLPFAVHPAGVRLPWGAFVGQPGALVHYVRSTGAADYDPPELAGRPIHTTLALAVAQCRSGRGDTILVLPGHTESVSSADYLANLVAGTKIIGLGEGNERGTLTWTTATSTILLDVANVTIDNLILNFDPGSGSVTVAAPITISAAGCTIRNCKIRSGTDGNSKVTIGITTTDAADDLDFSGNFVYGATAAEMTTFMDIIGVDRLRMVGNTISGATSNVAVGIVRFATTASLHIFLAANCYMNRKASSTAAVTGLAGVSGVSWHEHFHYLDTSSLTAWLTSAGIMTFHRPTVTNTAGETGTEVVGTVSA